MSKLWRKNVKFVCKYQLNWKLWYQIKLVVGYNPFNIFNEILTNKFNFFLLWDIFIFPLVFHSRQSCLEWKKRDRGVVLGVGGGGVVAVLSIFYVLIHTFLGFSTPDEVVRLKLWSFHFNGHSPNWNSEKTAMTRKYILNVHL